MPEKPQSRFPKTQWTLVEQLSAAGPARAPELLERFLAMYWGPIHEEFAAKSGLGQRADVEDLAGDFILEQVIQGRLIEKADRSRGRFNNFLRLCLTNWTRSRMRKANRLVLRGGAEGVLGSRTADDPTLAGIDLDFAHKVIAEAVEQVHGDMMRTGQLDKWRLVYNRLLRSDEREPHKEIARRLGLTPKRAYNMLGSGRRALRRALEAAVVRHVPNTDDREGELLEVCDYIERSRLSSPHGWEAQRIDG